VIKNIPKKLKVVAIIISVVAISLIIFLTFRPKKASPPSSPANLEITSSNPANGAAGVSVFDPMTVTFNQPADFLTITAISDPTEQWAVTQASPNSVKIDHKLYLRVATDYTLTILQHGNPIGKIVFETANEQNDPRFLQGLQTERDKKYPLLSLTPYETTKYRIVYSAPLTLEIDLKVSADSQEVILEVQSWVKSHGIDPSTHKYIVIAPSPTP
jgi:hypothetical protein